MSTMIKEDDYAIFRKGDFMKIFQIKRNKPIMIDRNKCKFDNILDQPSYYGFKYEIKQSQLCLVTNSIENDVKVNIVKDNRKLVDRTENQKLSHEDIKKLKDADDLTGTDIIDKLIENSSSFQDKTEYSQEKYIKRKKDKYLAVYEIQKPTMRTLCQYFMQGQMKRKIMNLRMDTISQILTYSNVAAKHNVMILESCKGLLLAGVVERLAGYGKIVNLSPNGSHISTKDILDYMSFPESHTKDLYNFPLEKVDKVQQYIDDMTRKIELATDNPSYQEKQTKKLENAKIVNELFVNKNIDCLIIACKFQPLSILERVINYLNSNRYFVIYSSIQEPLIECHSYLKRNNKAVHMELSDSWLREYQVLPERTHPKVMMDCCSGYILTGITVNEQ